MWFNNVNASEQYAPVETSEKCADVEKNAKEIPMKDVAAAVGQPMVYPKGMVSTAWKTAFFVLLAVVLVLGGGAVMFCGPPPPDGHGHDGYHHHGPHHFWGHGRDHRHGGHPEPHPRGPHPVTEPEIFSAVMPEIFSAVMDVDDSEDLDSTSPSRCAVAIKRLSMRCESAIKHTWEQVKAGKITREEAAEEVKKIEERCKAAYEALEKKCGGGKGERCAEAFKKLKMECYKLLKEIKEAAKAGKITPEVAKKKFEYVVKGCKGKAEALKKRCGSEVPDSAVDVADFESFMSD